MALAATPSQAVAQTTTKLTADRASDYGLYYTLPLTAFDVTVAVEKTQVEPGEYFNYARKYLAASAPTEASTKWRVLSAVINPVALPDTAQQYMSTFKGSTPVTMLVTERGFPVAINDDGYEPESDLLPLPQAVAPAPTILDTPVALQAMTEEMVQSRSSVKRAELAAARINELRQNRRDIVSGDAENMPTDGRAMELALSTIDGQEQALTAMFLGTTQTSVEVATFRVLLPAEGTLDRSVLCRLSATQGLVSADDLTGDPIYVTVDELSRGRIPFDEKGAERKWPRGGVAYRIPGQAKVTVDYDGSQVAERELPVAQLGVVYALDPGLFAGKMPRYQHFNPTYGSLRDQGLAQ